MILGKYERLDFRERSRERWAEILGRKEKKNVRIESDNEDKVQVVIKSSKRDGKTGRITYTTEDSFNVDDATPDQVSAFVRKAFENVSSGGGAKKEK